MSSILARDESTPRYVKPSVRIRVSKRKRRPTPHRYLAQATPSTQDAPLEIARLRPTQPAWLKRRGFKARLREVMSHFDCDDTSKVARYVLFNRPLLDLLDSAREKISDLFQSPRLRLEICEGYDYLPGGELVFSIGAVQEVYEASNLFDDFCESWWFDAMSDARGKMSIVLEFLE